jgi:cell division septation protein DedD
MEPALKQRVVGAAVLVALAVIFLPMLIKGPAPESGVSDVPLKLPDAPQGDGSLQTRELPLVAPGAAPASGVVGLDATDTQADDAAEPASGASSDAMMPAAAAGGDYAVSFGRYASATDADKVVAALRASQLPGYQESTTDGGRTLYRVRIGPYATQADAEAARLRAAHVRDDVGAKVVVLNADTGQPAQTGQSASEPAPASQPVAAATAPVSKPEPLAPEPKPAAPKPTTTTTKPAAPVKPAAITAASPPRPAQPAATDTGFAVQLGAFASPTEATKLRDRARAAGMRAFVDSVRTDKGVLSRVRVGPVLTRAEADQLKAQVAAKLGISDAIVKPQP